MPEMSPTWGAQQVSVNRLPSVHARPGGKFAAAPPPMPLEENFTDRRQLEWDVRIQNDIPVVPDEEDEGDEELQRALSCGTFGYHFLSISPQTS